MRPTLNLDEALEAAMKLSEGRTKSEVVNEALRRFVRDRSRPQLLDLRGTVKWTGNLDALRKRGVRILVDTMCLSRLPGAAERRTLRSLQSGFVENIKQAAKHNRSWFQVETCTALSPTSS
ncbi:MAG TPA: type II toxin-antitoxin system VapB family antitoxin [Thermoanaerobaculia bacterium]